MRTIQDWRHGRRVCALHILSVMQQPAAVQATGVGGIHARISCCVTHIVCVLLPLQARFGACHVAAAVGATTAA